MNPLIQFHVLPEPDSEDAFFKAGIWLIQKVYQGHPESHLVVLSNPEDLHRLDEWLWTMIPESFLPHSIEGETTTTKTHPAIIDLIASPQTLSTEDNPSTILINLSNQTLSNAQMAPYHNIHMIVGKSPEYREFCRSLFRAYKKNGIPLLSEAIAL